MATKLKKMQLTSVDLVRAGANQQADICLYKSDTSPEIADPSPSNIYKNAIIESIQGIISDETISAEEKSAMVEKSISQYHDCMMEYASEGAGTASLVEPSDQEINNEERNERTMKIDKSIFTAEELAQYEALIAKAKVDPEAGEEEMKADMPPTASRNPQMDSDEDLYFDGDEGTEEEDYEDKEDMDKSNCKKSADPLLKAAMNRLSTLEKSIAMKELTEVAKKYTPLGENETELAKTLYDMKQASEETYNSYIGILEKSLNLIEKSGIFTEIGKSTVGTPGGVIGKIEAAATEIQKSDASMSREMAIAKAWENHPELIAEYESEYRA